MPELTRRIESLDAVILQRAAEEKAIIVFPLHAGILAEPIFLRFGELSSQPRSMETILRTQLEAQTALSTTANSSQPDANEQKVQLNASVAPANDLRSRYGLRVAPAELPEHLSMVARWFYSKPRQGEIFFRDGEWPYRRILRACARLLAPPAASASSSTPPAPNS